MAQPISLNTVQFTNLALFKKNNAASTPVSNPIANIGLPYVSKFSAVGQPKTKLNDSEKQKYIKLLDTLKNAPISENSLGLTPSKQLDALLKNGKLLSTSSHDGSTVLDNLYLIATTERAYGLDSTTLISNTLDLLCNPRFVTQTFGDIPNNLQAKIAQKISPDNPVKANPSEMNVSASGTCAAASIEVNMADKYPAEFARWVEGLSSAKKELTLDVKLSSICKNKLEAIEILKLLQANQKGFDFSSVKIKVDADEGAYARAYVQNNYWNKGERNVADVLIQSAIMKLGSQNTYNSLNDTRLNNANPQGLIEVEKTFVESLIKNKEITSLVYQQIDEEQNLVGYNCSFDKIQKHITDTIDSGDDVILGYVSTNESEGYTKVVGYDKAIHGAANKVINGHEITVIDYYKDENGKVVFVCVDTDDNNPELVQYSADWLLPKIHHAGYPAKIVEADEKEIMKNMI